LGWPAKGCEEKLSWETRSLETLAFISAPVAQRAYEKAFWIDELAADLGKRNFFADSQAVQGAVADVEHSFDIRAVKPVVADVSSFGDVVFFHFAAYI
jgi:hypothetical protein